MGARSVHVQNFYDVCEDLKNGYSESGYKAAVKELNQLPLTDQEMLEGTLNLALKEGDIA
jgi:hypothetical protein